MIDEKKLIEDLEIAKSNCKHLHELVFFDGVVAMVDTQPQVDKWIPISARLPETNKDVLITFREYMEWNKSYRYGTCKSIYIPEHTVTIEDMGWCDSDGVEDYDEVEDICYVKSGWYEVVENWDDYTHVYINCEVFAWQPLPKPYKGE